MLKRCVVEEIVVRPTGTGIVFPIYAGQVIDMDQEIVPGCRLGDALAGRESCFVDEEGQNHTHAPDPAAAVSQPETPAGDEE